MKSSSWCSAIVLINCYAVVAQTPAMPYAIAQKDSAAQQRAFYLRYAEEIEKHANELFNNSQYAAALVYYDRLIALQPSQARFYFERARCLEALQAIDQAIEGYTHAIDLLPAFAEALLSRAHLYYQKGDYHLVIVDTERLLSLPEEELPPTNTVYFVQQLEGVDDLFSLNGNKMHILRLQATAKAKLGHLQAAIEDYTTAINLAKGAEADLYYERGKLYQQKGDFYKAEEDFKNALRKNPQHQGAMLALTAGDNSKKHLQMLIELQPDNAEALARRGALFLEEGNYLAALADFDSAEHHGYQQVALYINRGIAKEKLSRLEVALVDFSKALQMNPSPKVYNLRGNCYFKVRNYNKAISDYTNSLLLNPLQADIYYNRGIAYHYLHRKQEACSDLQVAISLGHQTASVVYEKVCR
ncbi:MAG: tetratricopeptide repeat protein [Cytophagales bacterium]|nr:tetratricopeptide repeat protein [Cytophagales bacterium]